MKKNISILILLMSIAAAGMWSGCACDELNCGRLNSERSAQGCLESLNQYAAACAKAGDAIYEKLQTLLYRLKRIQCEIKLATARLSNEVVRKNSGVLKLSNDGFESGTLAPWTPHPSAVKRTYEIVSNNPRSGRYCLKVTHMSRGTSYLRQDISGLEAGATYTVSCWMRWGFPDAGTAGINLELYTKDGKWLKALGSWSRSGSKGARAGWHRVVYELKTPHNMGRLKINIAAFGGGGRPFVFYVDDVCITKTKDAPDFIVHPFQSVFRAGGGNKTYTLTLIDSSQEKALQNLKVSLCDPDGTIAARLKYTLSKTGPNAHMLSLSIPEVKPDSYTLVFSAGESSQPDPVQFEIIPFSKPENISDRGFFLRNGEPFFPIGIYNFNPVNKKDFDSLKEYNFNTVYDDVYRISGRLTAYKKSGIAAVVYCRVKDQETGSYWKHSAGKTHLEQVENVVSRYRDDPGILFWQIEEEPSVKTAETIRMIPAFYRALKNIHPKQPLAITFGGIDAFGKLNTTFKEYYEPMCEVCEVDRYPLPDHPIRHVGVYMGRAKKQLTQPWQVLTAVLQCGWEASLATQGTPAQTRAMVYMALIHGAKGISYYAFKQGSFYLPDTPLWKEMKNINREILDLSMPLMTGDDVADISSDNDQVQFTAKRYGSTLYLITVNPETSAMEVNFALPEKISVKSVSMMGSKRAVRFANNRFRIPYTGTDCKTILIEEMP